MGAFVPKLPPVMGSLAAMFITFLSVVNQVSPTTTVIRAVSAYVVFSAFGLVLRYVLAEAITDADRARLRAEQERQEHEFNRVVPGTSVSELLDGPAPDATANPEPAGVV